MAQRYPNQRSQERRDFGRSGPHQSGSDHDRYRTGGERRYSSDWDDRYERDRGYEGDRSYAGSGYSEETGYRREGHSERDDYGAQQRGYPYQGSGPGPGRDRGPQNSGYNRGDFTGEQSRGFGEWAGPRSWDDVGDEGGGYYGTGHLGGGFGTAAGSRTISRSPYAPASSGIDFYGRSAYPGEGSRWQSQGQRGARDYGDDRSEDRGGRSGEWGERSREWSGGRQYRGQGRSGGYGGQSEYGYGSQRYGDSRDYRGSQGYGGPQRSGGQGYGDYGAEDYGGSRQQSFRGRGPKGYQRSDERLKELVCEHLMEDPDIDAGEVTIEVSGGVVTLTGTVEDRRTKYEIEEAAESVSGVKDINNQLRVQQRSWLSQSGSQGQSNLGSEASSGGRAAERSASSGTSSGTSGSQSSGTQGAGSTSKRN